MSGKRGKEETPRSSEQQQTILIVGKSHTGKSYLARDLVGRLGRPVYVVNDPNPPKPLKKITWDQIDQLRNAALVLEDVIGCTDNEFKKIQQTLSYACHHKSISPAIVICHSILKNRIHAVLGYVNYIYFTLTPSNATSIGAALRYFRFTKEEQETIVKRFLADRGSPYGYYLLDVENRTFERHALNGGDEGKKSAAPVADPKPTREDFVKAAERFLPLLPEPKIALAAFEMMIRKIPLGSVSPDDLSIELRQADSGRRMSLSLIDYLHVLTSDSKVRPSSEMTRLHRYVKKYVSLPRYFKKNRFLN